MHPQPNHKFTLSQQIEKEGMAGKKKNDSCVIE